MILISYYKNITFGNEDNFKTKKRRKHVFHNKVDLIKPKRLLRRNVRKTEI